MPDRVSVCKRRRGARWKSCSTTAAAKAAGTAIRACSRPGQLHHVVAIVDGGPKVITFVVDGALCDGGEFRQFGWGRLNPNYRGPQGDSTLRIRQTLDDEVVGVRLYGRALRTSEAIGNFRHGCPGVKGER